MPTPDVIEIEIPTQGISGRFDQPGAREFLTKETAWYAKYQQLLSENLIVANQNFGDPGIYRMAVNALNSAVRALEQNSDGPLNEYIGHARDLRCIVGQGAIGRRIDETFGSGDTLTARWMFYIFSAQWVSGNGAQAVAPFRAAIFGNPFFDATIDINSATQALRASVEAREDSKASAADLSEFINNKTTLISELEQLYRQKLIVDEPAKFWASVAASKTSSWRGWLVAFAILVLVPIVIVLSFWNPIAKSIEQITSTSTSGISFAGLGLITVPALLYAWLLKNVSKVFLQNLMLADDAAHRRALAITYLGLAENPKLQITPEDRALILNALFRPIPPHSGDDGPPAGLIDLVKNRAV
jgi:hypothetical protein